MSTSLIVLRSSPQAHETRPSRRRVPPRVYCRRCRSCPTVPGATGVVAPLSHGSISLNRHELLGEFRCRGCGSDLAAAAGDGRGHPVSDRCHIRPVHSEPLAVSCRRGRRRRSRAPVRGAGEPGRVGAQSGPTGVVGRGRSHWCASSDPSRPLCLSARPLSSSWGSRGRGVADELLRRVSSPRRGDRDARWTPAWQDRSDTGGLVKARSRGEGRDRSVRLIAHNRLRPLGSCEGNRRRSKR